MFNIEDGETKVVKFKFKGLLNTMGLKRVGDKIWLSYEFNKAMTDEMKKCFSGMSWHGFKTPPVKQWSILYNLHNMFQISFWIGEQPYKNYDQVIKDIESGNYTLPFKDDGILRQHQKDMCYHWYKTRRAIWAVEMGLGKSLAALRVYESINPKGVFWVSVNSGLLSVKLEYKKWNATTPTQFMTYDGLKKLLKGIDDNWVPPQVVIFDESQKIKSISAQRTEAAIYLVNKMYDYWGDHCYILLMTGTPAPKSPLDWYSQCEIARPGYLKEGNIHHFKDRLAIIEQKENMQTGGIYPELVTWLDDETKCAKCGKTMDEGDHDDIALEYHPFKKSVNEVAFLYERMKGLVLVKRKKDCLDLPDKIYQKIYCKPTLQMKQAMKTIIKRSPTAIKALMLCRELSDGFQYSQEVVGKQQCELCFGQKKIVQKVYVGPEKTEDFLISIGLKDRLALVSSPDDIIIDPSEHPNLFSDEIDTCPNCNGEGETNAYARETTYLETAKDKAYIDLLEEHEEYGRIVTYAGFTASVDKCMDLCVKNGWQVIRVDGRGWHHTFGNTNRISKEDMIDIFQNYQSVFNKVAFIAHPGSGSTGLTLTASPTIVHYSNAFKSDDRIQADDRIHRLGMDVNRGARIIDLIHLSTDEYVLENLMKKRRLEDLSMGQLMKVMDAETVREDYE